MDPPTDKQPADDDLLRRMFARVGRRDVPDAVALDRAEAAFRAALAPTVRRRKRNRMLFVGSLAAALVLVVLATAIFRNQRPAAAIIATVVRELGPVQVLGGVPAAGGATPIRAGQTLVTGATGRAAARYNDVDIRIDIATTVRFEATKLVLTGGAIYVDSGASPVRRSPPVTIETRFGTVSHTGTQFLTRVDPDMLTVSVREGTVFVQTHDARRDLSALRERTSIVEIDASGAVRTRHGLPYGGIWSWAPTVSTLPTGGSLHAYLTWLSREYGYALAYDQPATQTQAENTRLHGDLGALALADAIAAVNATTRLHVDVDAGVDLDDAGTLRVSRASGPDTGPEDGAQ